MFQQDSWLGKHGSGETHKGDVGVPSIGVPISKLLKYKNNNDKIPTITIYPMQILHHAIQWKSYNPANLGILKTIKSAEF